ncbi:MAG: MBOAT family protein [Butyrivibrio sp.]|nr:MBOAT family protein [Butyrivibrio sp.]
MQFSSYIFILLFLPLCLSGYFLLGKAAKYEAAKIWLLVMSFWFYGYMNWACLIFLAGSILVNYGLVYLMKNQKTQQYGKQILILALTFDLGLLFVFKYYNFFIDNVNHLAGAGLPMLNIILPIGLSFITFQQISFVVDSYKDSAIGYSFIDYALYVAFFPKISSGPITPFPELTTQLQSEERKKIDYDNLARGLYQFAMGLAKKVLIADTLAQFVSIGFSDINNLHTISALAVMLCYSLQLYYDFSGYSDMAIGIARMLNIELPVNFNSPYKAKSISDFWKRWHITLTGFLTKYVYIPLGGSRKGLRRTCINIMIVFLISGLWHGANWTFIVWGFMHGILMVVERITEKKIERIPVLGRVFTFIFVNAAWVIFRADTISEAFIFWGRIFQPGMGEMENNLIQAVNEIVEIRILCRFGFQGVVDKFSYLPTVLLGAIILLITFMAKNAQEKTERFCFSKKQAAITVLLMFWSIISLSGVSVFLYSNF